MPVGAGDAGQHVRERAAPRPRTRARPGRPARDPPRAARRRPDSACRVAGAVVPLMAVRSRSVANTSSSSGPGARPRSTNHSCPKTSPEQRASGGGRNAASVRSAPSAVAWLACAAIATRLRTAYRRTSTRWVMSARGGERPLERRSGRTPAGTGRPAHDAGPPARAGRGGTVASRTTGVPASSRGARADAVHLDVVGVPVAADRVVDREHVGVLLDQQLGQPAGRLLDVGVGERLGSRRRRCRPARSRRSRAARPGRSPAPWRTGAARPGGARPATRRRPGRPSADQPRRAVGGDDQHDPVALGRGARHGAGGEQRLVVGVRVEGDQRERHGRHGPATRRRHVPDDAGGSTGSVPVRIVHLVRLLPAPPGRHRDAGPRPGPPPARRRPRGARDHHDAGRARPPGPAEDDGADGVQVHRLAVPLPYELPVNPRANAGVREVLSGDEFDVAHVHAGWCRRSRSASRR